jgi:hypothetical protein
MNKELFLIKVADLADLISDCDKIIAKLIEMGCSVDSLQVRQELYLKHRYCEALTKVFHEYNAIVYVHEMETQLPKAA